MNSKSRRRSDIKCFKARSPLDCLALGMESVDVFGKPITLNYQGSSSFQTCAGGCCTLILAGVILSYLFIAGTEFHYRSRWNLN